MASKIVATPAGHTMSQSPAHLAVRELLGEHPEDIICSLESTAEVLHWIGAILSAASDTEHKHHALHLRDAARYLADDFGNLADCQHEAMRAHLRKHAEQGLKL